MLNKCIAFQCSVINAFEENLKLLNNGADAIADEKADKRVTKIYRPIYPIDEILVKKL